MDNYNTVIIIFLIILVYLKYNKPRERYTNNKYKFVFFIFTCNKNKDKRNSSEQTWCNDLKKHNIKYYFVYGKENLGKDYIIDGDNLYLKFRDKYENLPIKTKLTIDFFNKEFSDYDGMFKTDDDQIIKVNKLIQYYDTIKKNNYVGVQINKGKTFNNKSTSRLRIIKSLNENNKNQIENTYDYKPEDWCSGALYWLSNKSTKNIGKYFDNRKIITEQQRFYNVEDFMIGNILYLYNIYPKKISDSLKLYMHNKKFKINNFLKDGIVLSDLNSNEMLKYYKFLD